MLLKRTSIRVRLLILMICLTTLPVITVTWLAANNTRSSVEKEIISANSSRMLWADQYLNELIEQIDILFYTLQINQDLMNSMNDIDNPDPAAQFKTQNYIRDTLTTTFHANSRKVDDLTLYMQAVKKAFTVNYTSSGLISTFDLNGGAWSRILKGPVNMYFKETSSGTYAFHGINRFEDRQLLGGISVRIDKDVWNEVGRILQSEDESSVYLLNDESELLSGSTPAEAAPEIKAQLASLRLPHSDLVFRKTDRYFFFLKKIGDGQLTVMKAVPLSTVNRSAAATIRAGIWTGVLFAAISLLLSILVSLRISRPIVSLARTMRQTQIHNFELKSVQSRDEIGLLERGYNSMMTRIKELIAHEYQREIEIKNAQLMALQAQINPHFLNNTLHMIGGMALKKNAPEIYSVTRVIGDLLRYAIGSTGTTVPLADELSHTRNYLFIQEHRFAGRCVIQIEAEDEALSGKLPKFSLQPMVENAFEHGLQQKEGAWRLRIRIRRVGSRIAIMVLDEGVGMPEERLRQLRIEEQEAGGGGPVRFRGQEAAEGPRARTGIGLRNVDARLKLQFGAGYGIRIWSRLNKGTLVVLMIPTVQEAGEDNHV